MYKLATETIVIILNSVGLVGLLFVMQFIKFRNCLGYYIISDLNAWHRNNKHLEIRVFQEHLKAALVCTVL